MDDMDTTALRHPLNGSHEETARHMSDYYEGDLRGWRKLRVARHLARCEVCGQAYRSLLSTLAGLRNLGRSDPEPRPELADEVVARIRGGERSGPAP